MYYRTASPLPFPMFGKRANRFFQALENSEAVAADDRKLRRILNRDPKNIMSQDQKKIKILFLCTGNSCRSQMAEGWARALKGDVIEAYSAGIETHGLNPLAVRVMAEAGVDISGHHSKHVDTLKDIVFDYVITVCDHAHESCPLFPGKTRIVHVGFDDPPRLAKTARTEDEALQHYRRVRDEIRAFVEGLPDRLKEVDHGKSLERKNETLK